MSVIVLLIDINNKYKGGKNAKKGNTFLYRGSLEKEIEKSKKELEKIEKLLPYLEFSFQEAKKSFEKKEKRKGVLKDFILLGEEELKKEREKMKQGKRPTRKEKELLKNKHLNPVNWLVERRYSTSIIFFIEKVKI
ncbi:hypothetical protein EGW87_01850 [Enterococcus faecium]|nr:hypothetical protein EGW10_04970 [Enterococcus faecium]ROX65862.1 hypothetical protein EGW32_04965 [Enterococcus faecium]ROY25608.1 hypothetical protein EGW60_01260 [Enterococcus faecium]ROY60382.1 hypothetical protein EGW64_01260 [Enterococcus faecium]ROY76951.1 hypothetical protein EGW87_01850 [Enterococcus faecium]